MYSRKTSKLVIAFILLSMAVGCGKVPSNTVQTPSPAITDEVSPAVSSTPAIDITDIPEDTSTPIPSAQPTATDSPEQAVTPEPTDEIEPEPTSTEAATPTELPEPTAADTPSPTATAAPEPTATATPEPTATNTPVATKAETTPTAKPTATPVPTATNTPTPKPTSTPTPKPTSTPTPVAYVIPTGLTRDQVLAECEKLKDAKDKYAAGDIAVKIVANNIVTADMADYEKALAIHDYIADTTHYDYVRYRAGTTTMIDDGIPFACLVNHLCVCEGYAETFKALMDELGIPCKTIHGDVRSSDKGHAWNVVQLGGEWYYVDVTWDDGDIVRDDVVISDQTWHKYFLVPSEIMSIEHIDGYSKDGTDIPSCTSYYYYDYFESFFAEESLQFIADYYSNSGRKDGLGNSPVLINCESFSEAEAKLEELFSEGVTSALVTFPRDFDERFSHFVGSGVTSWLAGYYHTRNSQPFVGSIDFFTDYYSVVYVESEYLRLKINYPDVICADEMSQVADIIESNHGTTLLLMLKNEGEFESDDTDRWLETPLYEQFGMYASCELECRTLNYTVWKVKGMTSEEYVKEVRCAYYEGTVYTASSIEAAKAFIEERFNAGEFEYYLAVKQVGDDADVGEYWVSNYLYQHFENDAYRQFGHAYLSAEFRDYYIFKFRKNE